MKLENGRFVVDLDMGEPVTMTPEEAPDASPDPRANGPSQNAGDEQAGQVIGSPKVAAGPLGVPKMGRPDAAPSRFASYRRGLVAAAALMAVSGATAAFWVASKPSIRSASQPSTLASHVPNVIEAVPEPYHVVPRRAEVETAPAAASGASNAEAMLPPPVAERPIEMVSEQKQLAPQVVQPAAAIAPAAKPPVHSPATVSPKQDGGQKAAATKAQEKSSRAADADQSSVLLNLTADEAYGRSRGPGAAGANGSSTQQQKTGAAQPATLVAGAAQSQPAARRPVRLVTIISGNEIVISDPTTGLPTPVRVGAVLHDGSTLQAVDPKAGTAKTDKGVLRLE